MFEKWLDTFIEEKGIDRDESIEVQGPSGTNYMTMGVVIDAMKSAGPAEQGAIKNKIVQIDFRNGDVRDFFRHLAGALAR